MAMDAGRHLRPAQPDLERMLLALRGKGACMTGDADRFFPDKGGSNRAAKRICAGCRVRELCLEYAVAAGERFGVWGGLSEQERRQLQRPRKAG